MVDENEEITKIKTKMEELEKKLEDNTAKDKKHHEELKAIQEKQHQEKMRQGNIQNIGLFGTPISVILGVIAWWTSKKTNGKKNDVCKCSNGKSKEVASKTDLSGIVEIIREVKK